MLCYWLTSNAFSLVQVLFLRIPAVRQFFKIPARVDHKLQTHIRETNVPKQSFMEGFRQCTTAVCFYSFLRCMLPLSCFIKPSPHDTVGKGIMSSGSWSVRLLVSLDRSCYHSWTARAVLMKLSGKNNHSPLLMTWLDSGGQGDSRSSRLNFVNTICHERLENFW